MVRLICILILAIGGSYGYGWSQIVNSDLRLCDLLANPKLNLDKPVEIKSDSIKKTILMIDKDDINYSHEEKFTHIVLLAFSQWCGWFVGPRMEYDVFRLPVYFEGDRVFDIWSEKGGYYTNYVDYGNKIVYDPYIAKVSLNESLLDHKVVVAAYRELLDGRCVVALDAVIPYDGSYYRCETIVEFGYKVEFEFFETDDNNLKGKIIGAKLPGYIRSNGIINWPFFVYNFSWAFDGISNTTIQRLNIDPKRENITIKSLFYDND